MKRLSIILIALMVTAAGASAQKVIVGGGFGYGRPYYYHPYYRPYYGLGLGLGYGYPYYRPNYYYRHPSKLDRQIADIQHDYDDKISSARADDSLTGRERRHEVRELKKERDNAIDNVRRNYYKQPSGNYNNNNSQNNTTPPPNNNNNQYEQ